MKKRVALIFVILILCSFIVVAAEDNDASELDVENIKTEFGAVRGTINNGTENIFERNIEIDSGLLKLLFGEDTSIENLVLLVGIWFVLFMFIFNAMEFVPIFEEGKMKFFASIIVTILVVMTGTIDNLSAQYREFLASISWIGTSTFARIVFGIIFFFPLILAIKAITGFVIDKLDLEKARTTGENINMAAQVGKIEGQSLD